MTPAADLRVTLDTLLGEHALLAVAATQKGLDGAEDFEAAAAALDANSVEVSEAIASVYGDEAAEQFLDAPSLWRDHIHSSSWITRSPWPGTTRPARRRRWTT